MSLADLLEIAELPGQVMRELLQPAAEQVPEYDPELGPAISKVGASEHGHCTGALLDDCTCCHTYHFRSSYSCFRCRLPLLRLQISASSSSKALELLHELSQSLTTRLLVRSGEIKASNRGFGRDCECRLALPPRSCSGARSAWAARVPIAAEIMPCSHGSSLSHQNRLLSCTVCLRLIRPVA